MLSFAEIGEGEICLSSAYNQLAFPERAVMLQYTELLFQEIVGFRGV